MNRQSAPTRAQRLPEIAHQVGAVLENFDGSTLGRPARPPPSYWIPDDERKADAIIAQLRIDENAGKSSRRTSLGFGKTQRQAPATYTELYRAMVWVVQDNGLPGVLEVLLNRFKAIEGNVNLARKNSTSLAKRVRGREEQEERGRILDLAAERCRLDFIHLLAPLADQQSLDDALAIVLPKRALDIVKVLVGYGANTGLYEPTFDYAATHGDHEFIEILVRASKRVSQRCLDEGLLQATACESLRSILLLNWAGANAEHGGASALMHAIETQRINLAVALIASKNAPSGVSLDRALNVLFGQLSSPAPTTDMHSILMEALLCAGPVGDAANQGLVTATALANIRAMQLLLSYQADINFNDGSAMESAIQRNRSDLMGTLLQSQSLKPDIASKLVGSIPPRLPPMERVAILSKLLFNGASGSYCSEQLILAAETDDFDTAQLLIMHGTQSHVSPVCSVDYNGARALQTAVARNKIELIKLLALEGNPSKFSLAQTFPSIPPNLSGDDHYLIVQTLLRAGATGTEVDEALYSAVTSHRKSHRLIEILVQHNAKVTEPTLLAAVSQGAAKILDTLLTSNPSGVMCSKGITAAMKLPTGDTRYKIIAKLIAPVVASNAETREMTLAMIDVLRNFPEDINLLDLLIRQGKADVNLEDGIAVSLATRSSNFTVLKIVLENGSIPPSTATIEKALQCATSLPLTDINRDKKMKALLSRGKPQDAMNKALVQEIKSAIKQGQTSPTISSLLDAGADVNADDASTLKLSINSPAIMDVLLSKRPTPRSLSLVFPIALNLKDPNRSMLCHKLLQAGASGEEVNKSLCQIIEEGSSALSLMRLVVPHADPNYKEGRALRLVTQKAYLDGLDLLLNSRATVVSEAAKASAFQEAMNLKIKEDRYKIVQRLLKAGIPHKTISDGLSHAVILNDVELSGLLMQNGGSVEHKGAKAVRAAASAGHADILKVLVSSKPSLSTLTTGFGGASSLEGEAYFPILQVLLEAGLHGEVIDNALIETIKLGGSDLRMTELLCKHGASVEWKEGEAVVRAARSGMFDTIDILFTRCPSQTVLRQAFIAASLLPSQNRLAVIERLLEGGKQIDNYVTKMLTKATMEKPSDRQLIKMLLSRNVFDEGQSLKHAARCLDLRTLSLLVNASLATTHLSAAFETIGVSDDLWKSATGLEVMRLLLEKGAQGASVAEKLYQVVASLEKLEDGEESLANKFIDLFLKHGADVNYQRGLALQRATMQANVPLIQKLLPGASAESKAMSMPYIFTACDDRAAVLKALMVFASSFDNGEDSLDVMFRHPDENLEPMLFLALNQFPRDTQILQTLLDMGYSPNQWQFCQGDSDVQPEQWPILCWALEQPQKKISSSVIEMLIDAGADVKFISKTGITPLVLAIESQRVDIVKRLIAKGVDVTIESSEGITPLARATAMNNLALMEVLSDAGSEVNDGSLHDVTRELRMDQMHILVTYGHNVEYPSDRHDGRSALAELCLRGVDHDPTVKQLEKAIDFLIKHNAKIGQRINGKTIFHFALDSSNPILILTAMLKIMWEHINSDAFLYKDKKYTYSLTKYVQRDLFLGPSNQKDDILALLRKKQAQDRFWAHDGSVQPTDYCNGPQIIEDEVMRQKLRLRQQAEEQEDAVKRLELRRFLAIKEVDIHRITHEAELARTREKAMIDRQLSIEAARTQRQISDEAWNQSSHFGAQRRDEEVRHQKQLGDVQLTISRQLRGEELDTDRSRNVMQIEYLEKKTELENDAFRQRAQVEEQSLEARERINTRVSEREMTRLKMQKQLLGEQTMLAAAYQAGGLPTGFPGQRQITGGFVTEPRGNEDF